MKKHLTNQEMVKTLSSIFTVALTTEAVRKSWKWNYNNIIKLRMKKLHTIVLVLGRGEFDIRAVIRWSEPYYKNDIQVRLYLGDEVVNDFCCAYDHNIVKQACKQTLTPFVAFKHYSVDDVDSVEKFLAEYYRRDRFADSLIDTYSAELQKNGFCFISQDRKSVV